ncbi:hypothetical protein Tco_0698523 [Tanacetum coccineum]
MPTEMELTLEQTQQGVSYEVSNIRVNSFTMKMEILLEPTSNKLMVGDLCDSIRIKLVTTGKKRWKLKDGGEGRHFKSGLVGYQAKYDDGIFVIMDVARRSRLGAWIKACCLFIIPSESREVFHSNSTLFL